MPRFLFGDELGNLKSLLHSSAASSETKSQVKVLRKFSGTARAVQALAVAAHNDRKLLAAAYSDGTVSCLSLNSDDSVEVLSEWKEQIVGGFVGMAARETHIYSCSSSGALRLTSLPIDDAARAIARTACLPTRLHDWRLSSDADYFAYGGYEVDLSVWDTEKAFAMNISSYAGQKRPSKGPLLPAEIWRAKNVNHDSLGLRQPVRITSLAYISPSSVKSQHHIVTGTQDGDVRRYDTRAARRPVANWKGLAKSGSVRRVEKGLSEHEIFVSDHGSDLCAVDLRNGRIAYSYKGIAGAVTSVSPSPNLLASVSLDRFARLHSSFPLPSQPGHRQEHRGEVLDKFFVHSIPTVIVWDGNPEVAGAKDGDPDGDVDEIWNNMENVGGDNDPQEHEGLEIRKKRRTR